MLGPAGGHTEAVSITEIETVDIQGVRVATLWPTNALAEIERLYDGDEPAMVFHVNTHTLNLAAKDPEYHRTLREADLVLNDGKGVIVAGRMKGVKFPADLNGNFFTPRLLERAAERGWPTFLLGAKPGVADHAAARLEAHFPGIDICGTRDGYFSPDEEETVVKEINAAGTGLLLVGMGNPLQEKWLARCLGDTGARVGVGVGAFVDFTAGEIQRAPRWMNPQGLEWVYRLVREPRRMWNRYLVGNPTFLARAARDAYKSRAPR